MPALNALRTSDAAYNLRLPAEYAHQSPRNAPDPASQRALDTRLLRLRQTLAPAPPTSTTVATEVCYFRVRLRVLALIIRHTV